MAFFKFRKRGDDTSAPTAPAEGVEKLRRRAKHRLIGTVILVLVGVIGFPMLVDKQPRPVAVNIPIEIPDKNKAKPLAVPPMPASAPQAGKGRVVEALEPKTPTQVNAPAQTDSQPDIKPEPKATEPLVAKAAPKELAKEPLKSPEKAPEKAPEKTPDKAQTKSKAEKATDDAALRPQALLEGKESPKAAPAAEGRFIVQVGAFADVSKAREARQKLEQAGLKTYTQEVQTKDGQRIRVRVGPFGTKAEVDRAAEKIKKLDLPAAILTL